MTLNEIITLQPDVLQLNEQAISFIENGPELILENIIENPNDMEVHYEFYKNVALLQKK